MASLLPPREYWSQTVRGPCWPGDASVMLQASDGAVYASQERDATLAMLPEDTLGADDVELGCGVGRYTVSLAARARQLLAMNFVPVSIDPARGTCRRARVSHGTLKGRDVVDHCPVLAWHPRRWASAAPWQSTHCSDLGWVVYTHWNSPPGARPVWLPTRGDG